MTKAKVNASKRSFLFKRLSASINYFMIISMVLYTLVPVMQVSAEEMAGEATVSVASEATISAPSETAAILAPSEAPTSSEASAPAATEAVVSTEASTTEEPAAEEETAVEPLIEPLIIEELIVIEDLIDNSISTPVIILEEPTTEIATSVEEIAAPVEEIATTTEEIAVEPVEERLEIEILEPIIENTAKVLISEKVELGKTYFAPQNSAVTVTFTKLPENPGSLLIEEVILTPEQVTELGALSNVAYDITSSMEDGSFECDITLPIPAGETDVQIKNAEDVAGLSSAEVMSTTDVEVSGDMATVTSNHFTIFVASKCIASSDTVVTFGESPYYIEAGKNSLIDKIKFTDKIPLNLRFVFSQGNNRIEDEDIEWDGLSPKVKANLPAGEYIITAEYKKCGWYDWHYTCSWLPIVGSGKVYSVTESSLEFTLPTEDDNYFRVDENPLQVRVDNQFEKVSKVKFKIKDDSKTYNFTVDGDDCLKQDNYLLCDVNKSHSWMSLVDGRYSAEAKAYTKAGTDNSWVESLDFIIDSTDPEVSDLQIETDSYDYSPKVYVYSKSLTVSAKASDNQEVKNVDFYLTEPTGGICDGIGPIISGMENIISEPSEDGRYRTTFDTSALNGSYCINAKAEDLAGSHSETAKSAVILDNIAPRVELTNLTNGGTFNLFDNAIIDIKGSVEDANPHHYWLVVENSVGTTVVGPNVVNDNTSFTDKLLFSWNIASVKNGTYKVRLEARDDAGNKDNVSSVTFKMITINNKPATPTNLGWNVKSQSTTPNEMPLDIACTLEGSYTNENNISQNWSAVRGENIKYQREVTYPAKTIGYFEAGAVNYTLFTTFGSNLGTEGFWKTKVRAYADANNNKKYDEGEYVSDWSNECNITFDRTAPVAPNMLGFIDRANKYTVPCGGATNAKNITVDWTDASDSNLAGYDYQINYPNLDQTRGIWNNYFTASEYTGSLNEGIHYVKVRAKDKAGNVSAWSNECSIMSDTVAPTATFKHYIDGVEFAGDVAHVNSVGQLSFTAEYHDATPSAGLLKDSYVIFDAQEDHSFRFMQNGAKAYCGWRQEPNQVTGLSGTSSSLTEREEFTNCVKSLPDGEYYMSHQVYDNAIRKDIPSITQFRDVLGLHFIIDSGADLDAPVLLGATSTAPTTVIVGFNEDLNGKRLNVGDFRITCDNEKRKKTFSSNDYDGSIEIEDLDEENGLVTLFLSQSLPNETRCHLTINPEVPMSIMDLSENEIYETKTIDIADGIKPEITLEGESPVTINVGEVYEDAGATAYDNMDGDITEVIIVNNPLATSTSEVGNYTVTYDVTDSSGNIAEQVVRIVNVLAREERRPQALMSLSGGSFTPECRDVMYTCVNKVRELVNPAIINYCALTPTQQAKLAAPCEENGGTQQVLGVQKYSVGTLLRSKTTRKIYIVTAENIIKHVISLKDLWNYRNKPIISVDESVIASYSQVLGSKKYTDGTLVRHKGDKKIYVIINGEQVHLKTLKDLLKYFGHPILEIE